MTARRAVVLAAADSDGAARVRALGSGAVSPFADFEGFTLDRKQRRSTPYYVDARFENLGRFALADA
jgi:hypothetical protein